MQTKFIKTDDANIASKLRKNGYTAIGQDNKTYVFLNNGKMTFEEVEKNKVIYTNILNM